MAILSEGAKARVNTLLNVAKTAFHWGFMPTVLYLGFQKGNFTFLSSLEITFMINDLYHRHWAWNAWTDFGQPSLGLKSPSTTDSSQLGLYFKILLLFSISSCEMDLIQEHTLVLVPKFRFENFSATLLSEWIAADASVLSVMAVFQSCHVERECEVKQSCAFCKF